MKKNLLFLLFNLLIVIGFSQDIETGLVARYSFCGNVNDESGNDNHGEYMGPTAPTFVADVDGNENSAMYFNGIDDWVNVETSETMNSPVEEATVSCWVYYQSLFFGQWVPIFAKTDGDAVVSRQYSLGINGLTKQIYWHSTYVGQSDELDFNTWFHITVTYTPELLKCYLNGELIGEAVPVDPLTENEQPFQIGRDTPSSTDYFHGIMDEVNIYNRALSAADVMALKNYNGCSPSASGEGQILNNVNLYPNPVTSTLKIDLPSADKYSVALYNTLGQLVINQKNNQGQLELDMNHLNSGFYYLHVNSKEGFYMEKIIKK
jgi:hypothetical protein